MRSIASLVSLGLVHAGLLFASGQAAAGQFHHCDDGHGGRSYQSLPCSEGQTTVATRRYEDSPPTMPVSGTRRSGSRRPRAEAPAPRTAARTTRREPGQSHQPLAYACHAGGRQWVQIEPCTAPMPRGPRSGRRAAAVRPPAQRALSREEVCLRVRAGTTAAAPGERPARSAYRRNLLRERGRC